MIDEKRALVLDSHKVLVLSTGYEPLFKTNWKRAVTAVFCGRAEVVEFHESLWIGTGSTKVKFPTVVRFLTGIVRGKIKNVNFKKRPTKKTLWLRDKGVCQYCEKCLSLKDSTIDHIEPRSKGGDNSWENVVIACRVCNQKKGSKLLQECNMKLIKKPKHPKSYIPFLL